MSNSRTYAPVLIGWLIIAIVSLCSADATADDRGPIEFDIVSVDDSIAVWLDLSGLFGGTTLSRLHDGIDLGIVGRIGLFRPRKLFGSEKIIRRRFATTISYRLSTRTYRLIRETASDREDDSTAILQDSLSFQSVSSLLSYFSDSILVPLIAIDSLRGGNEYEIEFDIESISLGGLNLFPVDQSDPGSGSLLESLFETFLEVSGYGRREFSFKSRRFLAGEIEPIQ
ncbi:MAG: DUF4390 domain-containing protein [candidate division Zixibacteria bacterium]